MTIESVMLSNHLSIKKKRHQLFDKGQYSENYGFSSGHVWMSELDCEESWALKNWCFWTVVLEKTLESPLDCKEIKLANTKGIQPGKFIGRTDSEAETPILWPPYSKNWLIGKDPDAGKDWRWEEKGAAEDECKKQIIWGKNNRCCLVSKSFLSLFDPVDCSLPGSSAHGIFQARILGWGSISHFRGSPQLRDQTHVSCTGRKILYH